MCHHLSFRLLGTARLLCRRRRRRCQVAAGCLGGVCSWDGFCCCPSAEYPLSSPCFMVLLTAKRSPSSGSFLWASPSSRASSFCNLSRWIKLGNKIYFKGHSVLFLGWRRVNRLPVLISRCLLGLFCFQVIGVAVFFALLLKPVAVEETEEVEQVLLGKKKKECCCCQPGVKCTLQSARCYSSSHKCVCS